LERRGGEGKLLERRGEWGQPLERRGEGGKLLRRRGVGFGWDGCIRGGEREMSSGGHLGEGGV